MKWKGIVFAVWWCLLLSEPSAWAQTSSAWANDYRQALDALGKKSYAVAEEKLRSALAHARQEGAEGQDRVATTLASLGLVYRHQKKYPEAQEAYESALRGLESKVGKEHPVLTTVLINLGVLFREMNKPAQAQAVLERAIAIQEAAYGPDDLKSALGLFYLGELHAAQKQFAEAESALKKSLDIRGRNSRDPRDTAQSLYSLATLYRESGRSGQEETQWERYVKLRERYLPAPDPEYVTALENYAAALRRNQKPERAAEASRRAAAVRAELTGTSRP